MDERLKFVARRRGLLIRVGERRQVGNGCAALEPGGVLNRRAPRHRTPPLYESRLCDRESHSVARTARET